MINELLQKCYDELTKLNGLVVKSEGINCQFDELLDELSKEIIRENKTVGDHFREWDNSITELTAKTKELIKIKEEYYQKEFVILTTFDFKKKYGKDNDKIRNQHIKKELEELLTKRHELELQIDFLKLRIDYLQSIISIQKIAIERGA